MSKIQISLDEINSLKPTQIVESNKVEQKFIQMYNAIWGTNIGEQIYAREKFHFNKLIAENPSLQECSKLSLFGCFLDIAVNGLTLDQSGRPQVYVLPSNVKVKHQSGQETWEKRASLSVTAYGEVYMRQRAGQIRHVDNPVIVYEGDTFEASTDEKGQKRINYISKVPRKSNRPVAAFIKITRNDGSSDLQWMMETDWLRLANYSAKRNKGIANSLYTSNEGYIDIGFLENKIIKHAFDAYPKVRKGNYTNLETEMEDVIDYGISENQQTQETEEIQDFSEQKQIEAPRGHKVEVSTEDEYEGF